MSHLKYFDVMKKVSAKHRLFIVPGQSISLICIVVKIRYLNSKCVKKITRGSVMGRYFEDY